MIAGGVIVAVGLGTASAASSAGPIKVGGIATLSGPVIIPGYIPGGEAYYKWVNAHGGINGRQIQDTVVDDAGSPTAAAQLARQLIAQDNVDVLAGGDSANDCVNGKYYAQSGIVDISLSTDTTCFTQANIGPAVDSPATEQTAMLYYASNIAQYKKVCVMGFNIPSELPNEQVAIAAWKKLTGKSLTKSVLTLDPAADPLPGIVQMKDAGCQAVVSPGLLSTGAAIVKEALGQGMTHTVWLLGPLIYDPSFITSAGSAAALGIDCSDVVPWSDPALPNVASAIRILKAEGVPITGTALDGLSTAYVVVHVLKSIKGAITRASVTAAFKALKKPFNVPWMGQSYSFGPGSHHENTSPAYWFVGVSGGKWKVLTRKPVILPASAHGQ